MQSMCQFPECGKPVSAKNLCTGHYKQLARGAELAPLRPRNVQRGPCSFHGCPHQAVGPHGLCNGHRHQQRRGMELRPVQVTARHSASMQERLDLRTVKGGPDECWIWTGSKSPFGHGRIRDPEVGEVRLAHTVAFELKYGPVPSGNEVDHKCRVPACVNPSHLQLATKVTNGENRRGANKNSKSGVRNVSWSQGAWMVMVNSKGKSHYGGRFKDLGAAEQAAIALRNAVHTNNLADFEPIVERERRDYQPTVPEKRESGVIGIRWKANRWQVQVQHKGKTHYGGRFQELEDAKSALNALREKLSSDDE